MAIAPLTCSCGEPLGLVHETADTDSNGSAVFVGKLVCAAGHPWIDIRALGEDRPHGKAPKAWQRKDRTMSKNDKTPRKYHVVLSPSSGDVKETDHYGDARVEASGTLVIENAAGEPAIMYAAGQWIRCELSPRDKE
jgi:hypothetical protein